MRNEPDVSLEVYFEEYKVMSVEFKVSISFFQYSHFKYRSKPKGFNKMQVQNFELQHTLGKVTLPSFDGTSKCTARSWVHKLET